MLSHRPATTRALVERLHALDAQAAAQRAALREERARPMRDEVAILRLVRQHNATQDAILHVCETLYAKRERSA
jgi:hypothetical protein